MSAEMAKDVSFKLENVARLIVETLLYQLTRTGEDWTRPWNTEYVSIWQSPEPPKEEKLKIRNASLVINKFPLEVLRHTFTLSLPKWADVGYQLNYPSISNNSSERAQIPPTLKIPLVISQVCAHWREIALACPSLWAFPFLRLAPGSERLKQTQRLKLLDLWFKRSQTANLSFHFAAHFEGVDSSDFTRAFTKSLVPEMHRIVRLRFETTERDIQALFFMRTGLGSLKELTIGRTAQEPVGINLSNLSSLTSLTIDNTSTMNPRHRCPTWRNLTELYIKSTLLTPWRQIMADCPNLQRTSAIFPQSTRMHSNAETTDPRVARVIHMKQLQDLSLKIYDSKASLKLFDSLYLPSLSALEIGTIASGEKAFQWANPNHFFAQIWSLHRLVYRGAIDILVEILNRTPMLSFLEFTAVDDIRRVLDFLTQVNANGPSLPSLNVLKIDFEKSKSGAGNIPIWAIIKVMEKRSTEGYNLKELELAVPSPVILAHVTFLFDDINSHQKPPRYICRESSSNHTF